MTNIDWNSIQTRLLSSTSWENIHIDPIVFNKSFLEMIQDHSGIIKGLELSINNSKEIKISKGSAVCDSQVIIFKEDIILNIQNISNYYKPFDGICDPNDEMTVVIDYKYARTINNPPIAKIYLIKNQTHKFDINRHCSLGNVIIDNNRNISIINNEHSSNELYNRNLIRLHKDSMYNETKENIEKMIERGEINVSGSGNINTIDGGVL